MNFIEFLKITNKFNILTVVVIAIIGLGLYEAILNKWEGRNAKTNE